MDLSTTIAPTSDQLDAVDLLGGPQTFTIEKVTGGTPEQPVNVYLAEFPRPWRPGKSMRRVLVAAWGVDGSQYVGRRLTLFCDPTVMFGGIAVGGVRISHMSDIGGVLKVALLIKRGKSEIFTVQPLRESVPKPSPKQAAPLDPSDVLACQSVDELRALWNDADDKMRVLIEARVHELKEAPHEL